MEGLRLNADPSDTCGTFRGAAGLGHGILWGLISSEAGPYSCCTITKVTISRILYLLHLSFR